MHDKTTPNLGQKTGAKTPTRLGRGLGSLLGDVLDDVPPAPRAPVAPAPAVIGSETGKVWTIAVDWLQANSQQPRQVFESEALKDLTRSIKEKGILQPIVARRISERKFEIIAGERRWRAAQAAGLHEVPVILKEVSQKDALELAIIENIQREDLNPMDEAEALEHLITDYQMTQQAIADALGKERSTIANSLRLLSLSVDVKALVRNRQLSFGHAKVIVGMANPTHQLSLAKKVIAENLSVRATERLMSQFKEVAKTQTTADLPLNVDVSRRLIDGLSNELQKLMGTKTAIDYTQGKGKLTIQFYSDEQLTQIVDKLRKAWGK